MRGKMAPIEPQLFPAWDGLGIVQHHDAMPGTMSTKGTYTSWGATPPFHSGDAVNRGDVKCGYGSRYNDTDCLVLEDYFRRLSAGHNASMDVLTKALAASLLDSDSIRDADSDPVPATTEHGAPAQHEITSGGAAVPASESSVNVMVFNPLGWARTAVVEIPIPPSLQVLHGSPPPELKRLHDTSDAGENEAKDTALTAQMATDGASLHAQVLLPATSAVTFTLSAAAGSSATEWPKVTTGAPAAPLNNTALQLSFMKDGGLASITHIADAVTVKATLGYMSYVTSSGGPYMLVEAAPATPLATATGGSPDTHVVTVAGPIFVEVVQTFRGWGTPNAEQPGPQVLTQTTRLVAGGDDVVEVSHGIPVLPMDHELISRIHHDLDSDTVWTDDTGFELYPRKLNRSLPISGSYHALVNSAAVKEEGTAAAAGTGIGEKKRQLAVLSRHTMGVAALGADQLEIMMLRRINGTDDQGPWPLDERTPITVHTALLAGSGATVDRLRMRRALEQENQPVVQIAPSAADGSRLTHGVSLSGIGRLPAGMHLLSLYVRMPGEGGEGSENATEIVVQLQNVVEHSQPVVLEGGISALLGPDVAIDSCTEMTLTLQQPLAANKRMAWLAADATTGGESPLAAVDCAREALSLGALDVRSFVVELKQ